MAIPMVSTEGIENLRRELAVLKNEGNHMAEGAYLLLMHLFHGGPRPDMTKYDDYMPSNPSLRDAMTEAGYGIPAHEMAVLEQFRPDHPEGDRY